MRETRTLEAQTGGDRSRARRNRNQQIETVIFDFGGVFTVSPLTLIREEARRLGVDPTVLMDVCIGSYSEQTDHPWQRVERGEIALDDFVAWTKLETKHRLGVEVDPLTVMETLRRTPVRESMVQLVADLRQVGVVTALLTNNARELRPFWSGLADWDDMFDAIVDSSEVGMRKPAPEAFHLALARCSQSCPERALMIDDFVENLAGARAVGMNAVHVEEDPASAIAAVRKLVLS